MYLVLKVGGNQILAGEDKILVLPFSLLILECEVALLVLVVGRCIENHTLVQHIAQVSIVLDLDVVLFFKHRLEAL